MKGIILAGGNATRLYPLTKITSKQLLPVYNKPMIFYPINTLLKAGIKEILIIIAPNYAGHFLNLLGSGKDFSAKFSYEIQEKPRGLADAFIIGENFIDQENVAMILGDNIFEQDFSKEVKSFKSGGVVFAKKVPDPQRFGVVEFNKRKKVISIKEKPKNPKSNYALVGLYLFDRNVCKYAKCLKPSKRGELEITDLMKTYLRKGRLKIHTFNGIWEDAGTFDGLLKANNVMAKIAKKENK